MSEEKKYKFDLNSVDLIMFAWNRKWTLIILTFLAAVTSGLLSYLITPMYKSEVVLFAEPDASISKYLFSYSYVGGRGMLSFGRETESEHLMQVLNSSRIRDRIIDKFDLMNHYEIDTTHKYKRTLLYEAYAGHISFKRTKYLSVVISVLDKDPQVASDIANDIATLVDTVYSEMLSGRALMGLKMVEEQIDDLRAKMKVCEDSLRILNKLGINHYEAMSERLIETYGYALKDGNMEGAKRIEKQLDKLGKYGAAYVSVRDRNNYYKSLLHALNSKYVEAKAESEQIMPHKYVVDYAYPAERKSFPKRILIVMVSALATFLFAYFMLLIVDIIRKNTVKS
jgi:uncharacterized protein involved in exopolysaccharide biosynthesis